MNAAGLAGRAVLGLLVGAVALGVFLILSFQSTAELHISVRLSAYTKYDWALAAGLLAAAGVVVAVGWRDARAAAAAGGAIAAAQLIGAGAVAFKHWQAWFGPRPVDSSHLPELKRLAAVLAVIALLALVCCLGYLIGTRAFGHEGVPLLVRTALCVVAAAVALGVPYILAKGDPTNNTRTYLGFAALYSLPWGVALAVSAWLRLWPALGVYLTVGVSAVAAAFTDQILNVVHQGVAFGFAAAAAGVALLLRWVGETLASSASAARGP